VKLSTKLVLSKPTEGKVLKKWCVHLPEQRWLPN